MKKGESMCTNKLTCGTNHNYSKTFHDWNIMKVFVMQNTQAKNEPKLIYRKREKDVIFFSQNKDVYLQASEAIFLLYCG